MMPMTVEWRLRNGTDALVLVDPDSGTISEVPAPDGAILKAYLAVTGTLAGWQTSMAWSAVDSGNRDPDNWGELVLSRGDNGDVISIDPELFWERVHRWFRSHGVDYNS